MTPRQIRSLLKVMELGSVQRAARELHLAPSSISAQIRELSAELGVTLLEPAGRGIIPSSAARQLLPSLRSFLALSDEIRQQASSIAHEPGGVLRIFAPSSMCIYRLPPLINALQAHAPQVEVMLEHEPFDHLEAFRCGELDAAVLVSQVESEEWINHRLHAEDVIFVCHPNRHQRGEITLEQLNREPLITTEIGCSYRVAAEVHFRTQGLTLKPRQSFSNVEVIRRCLLANMGIGLLPRCAVEDDLNKGLLRHQAVQDTPYPFFSTLVYPKGRSCPPKLQALIEVCSRAEV